MIEPIKKVGETRENVERTRLCIAFCNVLNKYNTIGAQCQTLPFIWHLNYFEISLSCNICYAQQVWQFLMLRICLCSFFVQYRTILIAMTREGC